MWRPPPETMTPHRLLDLALNKIPKGKVLKILKKISVSAMALGILLSAQASLAVAQDQPASAPDAFEERVRAFIMENPEVIMDSLRAYEERRVAEEGQAASLLIAENYDDVFSADLPYLGNADGDVSFAIFSDYNCPHCMRAAGEIDSFLEADGNARVVVHEFPILGESSSIAARYALAVRSVGGDEAYVSAHRRIFDADGVDMSWARADAEANGLSWEDVETAMSDDSVISVLRSSADLGDRLGVRGTPFIVVGQEAYPGVLTAEQMGLLASHMRQSSER